MGQVESPETAPQSHESLPDAWVPLETPSDATPDQTNELDIDEQLMLYYRDFILFGEGDVPRIDQVDEIGGLLLEALGQAEAHGIHFQTEHDRRNTVRLLLGMDIVYRFVELKPKEKKTDKPVVVSVRARTEHPRYQETRDWRKMGACLGAPSSIFYPDSDNDDSALRAKQICAGCRVRVKCLEYALEHREKNGVWGGATERERRRLRRQRSRYRL